MNQENSYSAPNVTRMKKQWPSWAAGNGWAPDDIPTELASLGVPPHTAIKSYLILVMTEGQASIKLVQFTVFALSVNITWLQI